MLFRSDGKQIREIRNVDGLFDVGPVLKPAYAATEAFVSRRALEIAGAEKRSEKPKGYKPTAGMAAAAKKGLRLHEEGRSGDGLKPETVARANKIARRERLTEDHVVEMSAWFKRHAVDKKAGWDAPGEETPGYVAYLLWGGRAGANWSSRKSATMKADERDQPAPEAEEVRSEDEQMPETEPSGSLSQSNYDLYESVEQIAERNGPWPQEGVDGAHYMKKSPFAGQGMKCENCVFWNEGGSCDVVAGQIERDAICKLWVIPEEKLTAEDALKGVGEGDDAPTVEQVAARSADSAAVERARIKAKALEAAANARRT